ncbi:hypothetical protein MtrunA17_Chr5g0421721 [Medicago truncatula]|uniref:Uncharacterized protein n=1 Tax=Medicago truncatula TaxID=3880 RepID=A0A072TGL1_MEDTR|nr:hypothetical protein MTR_0317s0030 [Medicago truncatula]RHN55766.1 hypothetical protein MtrunA17_Chr5g0421721 [Medicago truncatula]
MAFSDFQSLPALHCLEAPLDPNPISEIDKIVNDLGLQYKTFFVEFHAHEGALMLPKIFSSDFGEQIGSFARLFDPNDNQFEVQVERSMVACF